MAAPTHDDGFHEIQLNGKQLVFLFMAATVVSVVIFLCGVLVGRGVRAERAVATAQAEALAEPKADTVLTQAAPQPPQPAADVTKADAPPTADEPNQPTDEIKPEPARPAVPAAAAAKPASSERAPASSARSTGSESRPAVPAPAVKESAPQPVGDPAAPAVASGSGYAVQVAAVNVRSEADAIAKRLASKGYATYVQVPTGTGNATVFRVRVGTFKTRREAETVAARLQKEEQIKPWITR